MHKPLFKTKIIDRGNVFQKDCVTITTCVYMVVVEGGGNHLGHLRPRTNLNAAFQAGSAHFLRSSGWVCVCVLILKQLWNEVTYNSPIFVLQCFICCVLMKKVLETRELVSLNPAFPLQRRKLSRLEETCRDIIAFSEADSSWGGGGLPYDKVTFHLVKTTTAGGGLL